MKLDKKHKIEACAAREQGRYAMHGVAFERGRAIATNGRILAVVPAEVEDGDEPRGQIAPREALSDARKVGVGVRVNGKIEAAGRTHEPLVGEFPRYRAVIPAAESVSEKTHAFVTLDPTYLEALFDAIALRDRYGSRAVTFAVPLKHKSGSPVVLVAHNGGGLGVIMPVTVEESEPLQRVQERLAWAHSPSA